MCLAICAPCVQYPKSQERDSDPQEPGLQAVVSNLVCVAKSSHPRAAPALNYRAIPPAASGAFRHMASLCDSPGWPGTCSNPPVSASSLVGLQACSTTPSSTASVLCWGEEFVHTHRCGSPRLMQASFPKHPPCAETESLTEPRVHPCGEAAGLRP